MEGTWLCAPGCTRDVLLYRAAFIVSLCCGIVLKATLGHGRDVKNMLSVLSSPREIMRWIASNSAVWMEPRLMRGFDELMRTHLVGMTVPRTGCDTWCVALMLAIIIVRTTVLNVQRIISVKGKIEYMRCSLTIEYTACCSTTDALVRGS